MGASPKQGGIQHSAESADLLPSYTLLSPERQTTPAIYASPHSGRFYPNRFIQASPLNATALRRSEDAFVDDIYECCVEYGSPILKANYPRAYVDVNREPYELDPDMFDAPLPSYVNVESQRALAGLGTVAKVVTNGANIYEGKLNFEEVVDRINYIYHPYHATLLDMIENTLDQFGTCLLIDCHSMPSGLPTPDGHIQSIDTDIILGDRFGTSCSPWITDRVQNILEKEGFSVRRNRPYAGGFTTQHYGDPTQQVHTLQIELNRALYMNEKAVTPLNDLALIKERFTHIVENINMLATSKL